MSIDDFNDDLQKAGASSASFAEPGDVVKGKILDAEKRQATEFGTGEPKFTKAGQPVMQWVFTLEVPGEDDPVKVYTTWRMERAVQDAVRTSGQRLAKGGTLAIKFTGLGDAEKGMNPPKEFAAKYTPPSDIDDFDATPAAPTPPAADEDF